MLLDLGPQPQLDQHFVLKMRLCYDGFDDGFFALDFAGEELVIDRAFGPAVLPRLRLLQVSVDGAERVLESDPPIDVGVQDCYDRVAVPLQAGVLKEGLDVVPFHDFWVDFCQFFDEAIGV